jgi:hypothetical protein
MLPLAEDVVWSEGEKNTRPPPPNTHRPHALPCLLIIDINVPESEVAKVLLSIENSVSRIY